MAIVVETISESYTSRRFRYMKLTPELNHVCSRAYLNTLDLNKNTLTRAMAASQRNEVSVHSSKDRQTCERPDININHMVRGLFSVPWEKNAPQTRCRSSLWY